ncbi:peptidase U32 family protein [Caldalkalibacillus mannanilyticus]|uniref:peptidase U32 family protein n=1 Tax=Caldalkalibacillus mannanilyticus TaxID=1418 RepID=UPI000468C802|nr:peptidase U32 family protein [Caldalkalibacillus mannanilyticus]
MKKIELLVSVKDMHELTAVIEAGADAVCVGHQQFGLRVPGDFQLSDIESAVQYAQQKNVKVYVMMNSLLHNDTVEQLEDYLRQLHEIGVDTLVFGDPAVWMTVQELKLPFKLHWNAETTSTNYETIEFWKNKGIKRAVVARELTLTEVQNISLQTDVEIEVQIHGMTCIFHSKRQLVSHYFDHINQCQPTEPLFLREQKEAPTHYPIYEDGGGTHIMSNEDICMIEHLPAFIESNVKSVKIEGLLKPTAYNTEIVRIYREAMDTYCVDPQKYKEKVSIWLEQIKTIQPNNRKLSTGFYFKEQVY